MESPAPADRIMVGQPWPNPSTGAVSLTVAASTPKHVTLSVFNLRGDLEETPYSSLPVTGTHLLTWNGNFPPGTCLLRLEAEGENTAARVVVLR